MIPVQGHLVNSGVVEPNDIVINDRGTCKAIYNNFNLFFGVTHLL
jgi:hypothetical protein